MQTTTISVQIRHPEFVVATGLCTVLAGSEEFSVAMDTTALPADVLVTDYAGGLELARQRLRRDDWPAILVVSQLDREWEVRTALESGVHGYLQQSAGPNDIVQAVRKLGRGERYVSDALSQALARSFTRDSLTRRETDVLKLVAEGYCNKLIARELGIGVGTVKTHVQSMMSKLDVHGRTHAVAVATQRGLVMAPQ